MNASVCSVGAPLFDSSSNFTDPQTLQLLQHSQRLLSNLSTIFHCLLSEAQELTQKGSGFSQSLKSCCLKSFVVLQRFSLSVCLGLVGLMNKNMVSSLISKYAQVVLWFCRTGLLPEGPGKASLEEIFLKIIGSSAKQTFNTETVFSPLSPPDDDALQISRPFYTHSVVSNYYTIRREELIRLAK